MVNLEDLILLYIPLEKMAKYTCYYRISEMPTRSGRSRLTTSFPCQHCGRPGYTANIYPSDDYSPDVPALSCTQCVRNVETATGGINQFQMVYTIDHDPRAAYSTFSARPPTQTAPSALSSAMAFLEGANISYTSKSYRRF